MPMTLRIAFMALPLAMGGLLQGQVSMRAGLWENTVTARGKTVTRTTCVTPEQERQSKGSAASLREAAEKSLPKDGSCKIKEYTVAGVTQTMVMVCGQMTLKHITTFQTDSFETVITMIAAEPTPSSVIKGRRIGECPAGGVK